MANDITPVDYTTTTGQVRALINDVDQWPYDGPYTASRYRLSDGQVNAFLAIAGEGRIHAAGALALRALAANEALVNKVIKTEDLSTDGAALATSLRLLAKELDSTQKDIDTEDSYDSAFQIVDYEGYPYRNWEA